VVLRAGLPFYQGFLNYYDRAESAFIASYRGIPDADYSFDIKMDYMAAPSLEGKVLILIDPMLATGRSLLQAYESICRNGKPSAIHIASVISSVEGRNFIEKKIPNHTFWTGAIDEKLNYKSYIVPGLGDAGDLSFGNKM
jgi:uracil phosphoribosyltransferase